MDLHLRGKCALVTGSTSGIGFAAALGLAQEGVSVIINGRTAERVNVAVDRIQRQVVDALASGAAGDLSSARGVEQVTERVPEVDILVNNMGIFEPRPFGDITDEEWFRAATVHRAGGGRPFDRLHLQPAFLGDEWCRAAG